MVASFKHIVIFITIKSNLEHVHILQAFIKTAAKILQNIQEGVFDVSNEVTIYLQSVSCKKMWEVSCDEYDLGLESASVPRQYGVRFINQII